MKKRRRCDECARQTVHEKVQKVNFLTKLRSFNIITWVCLFCRTITHETTDEVKNPNYRF